MIHIKIVSTKPQKHLNMTWVHKRERYEAFIKRIIFWVMFLSTLSYIFHFFFLVTSSSTFTTDENLPPISVKFLFNWFWNQKCVLQNKLCTYDSNNLVYILSPMLLPPYSINTIYDMPWKRGFLIFSFSLSFCLSLLVLLCVLGVNRR